MAPLLMLRQIFSQTIFLLFLTINGAQCEDEFKEDPPEPQEITIVGPSMVFDQLLPPDVQKRLSKELHIRLKLVPANSVMAVEALVEFQASLAIIADDFENISDVILEIKPGSMIPDDFEVLGFSSVNIVIITHPSNQINELTREQAAKIFKGEVTNWRDVGGRDSPVSIYVENGRMGIKTNLIASLLQPKEKITENSYSVNVPEGLITGVREHEEAISYYLVLDNVVKKNSTSSFLKGVKILKVKGIFKDTQKLSLVVRHDLKDRYEAIIEKLQELAD